MEKYLINVVWEYVFLGYRQRCFEDLFKRKNIKTIVFCQIWEKKEVKEKGYEIRKYKDFEDLKRQLFEIWKQKIFYINTFDEKLILEVNILKKELWFAFTEKFEIFRNKDLQRKYLFEKFPETTVKFQEIDLEKDEKIIIDFPCMIKPTSSAQSSGVAFLKDFEDFLKYKKNYKNLKKSLKDRWYEKNKFILEEFIDGEMFTFTYFVNSNWDFFWTPLVKVDWVKDLWIDDFSNYVRISEKYFEQQINKQKINDFVRKHIKTFWIKNTFVHHDFKINSKWELKTIELNWRIWGYRLELNQEVYDFNLFDLIDTKKEIKFKTDFYFATFVFYSEKKWILKSYNKELETKFREMKSFLNLRKIAWKIWKMTWLAKDWFSSNSSLKIKNKNREEFEKDFDFIKKNYKNFLIVE